MNHRSPNATQVKLKKLDRILCVDRSPPTLIDEESHRHIHHISKGRILMIKVEHSLTIDRAPDDVFNYVVDPAKATEWDDELLESKLISGGSIGVGSVVTSKPSSSAAIWIRN